MITRRAHRRQQPGATRDPSITDNKITVSQVCEKQERSHNQVGAPHHHREAAAGMLVENSWHAPHRPCFRLCSISAAVPRKRRPRDLLLARLLLPKIPSTWQQQQRPSVPIGKHYWGRRSVPPCVKRMPDRRRRWARGRARRPPLPLFSSSSSSVGRRRRPGCCCYY